MLGIDINQAKQNFPELIEKSISVGEIIITKGGRPIAELVPITNTKVRRKIRTAKGLIKIADDFDQPIDDFKEYM